MECFAPLRTGLDIGSASVKLAAILAPREARALVKPLTGSLAFRFALPEECRRDNLGSIIVSECRRSLGNPFRTALDLLREFEMLLPDSWRVAIRVTGSGGHRVTEALNLPFENEFKAIARGVSALYPQICTVFEMGGENSKYLLLDRSGSRNDHESADPLCRACLLSLSEYLRGDGDPAVLLVGRPYNIYDRSSNCDVPRKLRDLYGVNVLPLDFLPLDDEPIDELHPNMFWNSGRRILAAGRYARQRPNIHIIYITNFKCGPDSFVKFFLREVAKGPFLVLQFDGHGNDAGYLTRCEAYLDSKGLLRCPSAA